MTSAIKLIVNSMLEDEGHIVFLIGAGASASAGVPLAKEFKEGLIKQLNLEKVQYKDQNPTLEEVIAEIIEVKGIDSIKETDIYKSLKKFKRKGSESTPDGYKDLLKLVKNFNITFLNLNFDELLEKSFDEEGIEAKLLITDKDFEKCQNKLEQFEESFGEYKRRENLNIIIKPHGTISNIKSMRIIPSHTKSLPENKKDVLHNILKSSELVCVGYSASDIDIIEVLKEPQMIGYLKGLYWISSGDMNENVKEVLNKYCNRKTDARVDKIYIKRKSDDFFRELIEEIDSRSITLRHFPERFFPLTIIVGDRREEEPKTPGDLLAYSASTMDLRDILKLRLQKDTDIWGDKIIVNKPKEELENMLGSSNLLIIASPATNWLARKVNQTAIFRFYIELDKLNEAEIMENEIREILTRGGDLVAYKKENFNKLKDLTEKFKGMGFPDPIQKTMRGQYTSRDVDFGCITFCEHPYSENHYAIMIAGHYLPGTFGAIKFLSNKENFKDRPLGGIIKVRIPELPFFINYTHSKPQWDTPPYSIQMLEDNLKKLLDDEIARNKLGYKIEEVQKKISLLNAIKKLKS
jgi:hypothetical protein